MNAWVSRLLVLSVVVFGSCAACTLLLPEEYAVNAPIMNSLFGWDVEPPSDDEVARRVQVAPGYSFGRYAFVPKARFLRPTPAGDLLVSQPRQGAITLLERDADGDGLPDGQRILLEGLNRPHGLDLLDDWLYIGEADAISRVRFDAAKGETIGAVERLVEGLPEGGNHWTRTLRVGPDGRLYLSLGSSCNVCFEEDERRAAMMRFEADGSGGMIYARGLRNAVGFDWHPTTGELYATDNGRDLLGDDFPPCELNLVVEGGDYGWPVANGDRVKDPDLGEGHEERIAASIPPAHPFRAHNAPLGIAFLRHADTPESHRNAGLVALHGSWNRTEKDGYKVVSLHRSADGSFEERDFLWGFLEDEDVIGRPVDVAEGADGSIFVSDDYAGVIYRVVAGEGAADFTGPQGTVGAAGGGTLSGEARALAGAAGRELFLAHDCVTCHEPELAPEGVVPVALVDLASRHDVDSLESLLETPTPPMPVADLTPDERRQLAVFLLDTY